MDLGRVQGSWLYDIPVKRDLHHDVLPIGNCKSDLNCDSLPFSTLVSGGPLRPLRESKTSLAALLPDSTLM
jgi:hypothetical protein